MIPNKMINSHNSIVELLEEPKKSECIISPTDNTDTKKRKCARAYSYGAYYFPLVRHVLSPTTDADNDNDADDAPAASAPSSASATESLDEAESSTARVRKYYKKHPKKVKAYLKKTVKDRVIRNRDRAKAVKKHGKSKMKNHDVHHPNGTKGKKWVLAKKDHGRDPVKESFDTESMGSNEKYSHYIMHPLIDRTILVASGLSYPTYHPAYKVASDYLQLTKTS